MVKAALERLVMSTTQPTRNPWTRPFELIALAAWVVLIVFAVRGREERRKRIPQTASMYAVLSDLTRALEAYASDYGTYPSRPDKPLVADTTYFIQCLRTKGQKGHAYYTFREDDIVSGEFMSVFEKPLCYTYPTKGVAGPDGVVHNSEPYYLWTWGWRMSSDAPAIDWAINNWSRW